MVLSLAGPRYVWSLSQVELPQEETLELQMFWITMTHSKPWSYQTIIVCCTAFNRFALNESAQDFVVFDVMYFISCLHEISRKNLNFLWRQSVMDSVECWWGQGCGASFPNWWVQLQCRLETCMDVLRILCVFVCILYVCRVFCVLCSAALQGL